VLSGTYELRAGTDFCPRYHAAKRASNESELNFPRRGKLSVPAKHNPERGHLSEDKIYFFLYASRNESQ